MDKNIKKKTVRRLKILEGQIRGLQRMVEEESYCTEILHQSLAVKNALTGIESLILENHLSTHVVDQIKNGQEGNAIKEMLEYYKLSHK